MSIVMPTALDATSSSTRRRNPSSARFGGLAEVVEELDRELAWQGRALNHRLHGSRAFTLRPLQRRVHGSGLTPLHGGEPGSELHHTLALRCSCIEAFIDGDDVHAELCQITEPLDKLAGPTSEPVESPADHTIDLP